MTREEFKKAYVDYVETSCSSGDCYPQPAATEDVDGALTIHALALDAISIMRHVRTLRADPSTKRLAFGLDRTTQEDQGTTLSNVFTYMIVEKDEPSDYGFVEYDGEGDVRHHELVPGDYWHASLAELDAKMWPTS